MIFAGKRRVAQIKTLHSGPQVSALIVALGGSISYYHTNHIDSTDVVTNAVGRSEQNIVYYPYGKTQGTSGDNGVDYKFTGKELDDSTGLYFYEARYYDAELGRFISADTIVPNIKNPQSFNRYSYVLNNPLKFTDPSGNKPKKKRKKKKRRLKAFNQSFTDFGTGRQVDVPLNGGRGATLIGDQKRINPKEFESAKRSAIISAGVGLAFADGPLPFGDAAATGLIVGTIGKEGLKNLGKNFGKVTEKAGRIKNFFKELFEAKGSPHTVFRRNPNSGRIENFQTFDRAGTAGGNKRFRGTGKPHGGVEPPLVIRPKTGHPGGRPTRARPARPDETPKGFKK